MSFANEFLTENIDDSNCWDDCLFGINSKISNVSETEADVKRDKLSFENVMETITEDIDERTVEETITKSADGDYINYANKPKETGYNSEDEYEFDFNSLDSWEARDKIFKEKMEAKDFILVDVKGDGSCLFRSLSVSIYGNERKHNFIRQKAMDFIMVKSSMFRNFLTEDLQEYVRRKRKMSEYGNQLEITVISELYNRTIELYDYDDKPAHLYSTNRTDENQEPLRIAYLRKNHYNAIIPANDNSIKNEALIDSSLPEINLLNKELWDDSEFNQNGDGYWK